MRRDADNCPLLLLLSTKDTHVFVWGFLCAIYTFQFNRSPPTWRWPMRWDLVIEVTGASETYAVTKNDGRKKEWAYAQYSATMLTQR